MLEHEVAEGVGTEEGEESGKRGKSGKGGKSREGQIENRKERRKRNENENMLKLEKSNKKVELKRRDGTFEEIPPTGNTKGIVHAWQEGHHQNWGGNRFSQGHGIKHGNDEHFDYDAGNEWYPENEIKAKGPSRVQGTDNPLGLFASLLRLLSYLVRVPSLIKCIAKSIV